MARIIRTGETPAKLRNAELRSIAEVLRELAARSEYDDEAKDMAAFVVVCLRKVSATIESSAASWEDRDYWRKAESLRTKWRWTDLIADRLERLVLNERWDLVPEVLIDLVPYVQHIRVVEKTRNADWWCGSLRALRRNQVR